MHEMSIAINIFEIVSFEAKKNNLKKISKVKLKIGEMANIVPECLESSWNILVEDTLANGSKLEYDYIPVKGKCRECSFDFEIKNVVFLCPKCKSPDIKVTAGEELDIEYVEGD